MENYFKKLEGKVYESLSQVYNAFFGGQRELMPAYATLESYSKPGVLEEEVGYYMSHGSKFGKRHKARQNAGKQWKQNGGKLSNKNNKKNNGKNK